MAVQAKDYNIVGSFNNQRVTGIDSERSVNVFEYRDPLGKKPKSLINTSGLINTHSAYQDTTGGFRAQFVFNTYSYSVIGSTVLRQDVNGIVSILGTLVNTNVGYVGIDANTFQILFVDGRNGYIFDTIANTFTMITDTGFPVNPIDCCFLDGFFVVATGGTNNFQLSQFNQGMVWSGSDLLDFTALGNILTIPTGTANFATGVDVQLVGGGRNSTTFTADTSTNLITVGSTADYPQGSPVSVKPGTSGVLPSPLSANSVYWVINVSGTTLKLATTKDKATSGDAIILTNNGTPPNNIISTTSLPSPLQESTTYYVIRLTSNTIELAATLADAQNGIPITLTSVGTPPNQIENNGQLQLGSITSHPGNIVACRTLHRRLFLFSSFYTEVWENAGIGTNLPFRRNNSLLMEYGTPCVGSISVSFDIMCFLSQTRDGLGPVVEVKGTQAIPISNNTIDSVFAAYAVLGQVADCRAFLILENGLIFYRMNFTAANHTFVYDVTLSDPTKEDGKMWHEEEVLNGDRHPAQTHAYFNGINYVGDYFRPILYQVDSSTTTNNGQDIRRMRIARPIVPEAYQRIRCDRWQLDLLQGQFSQADTTVADIQLLTENGDNIDTENGNELLATIGTAVYSLSSVPFVFLSLSKDGGQTYGYLVKAPMGRVGNRTFRTVWRKLGTTKRGQPFQPKIEFFSNVPFIILGAAWVFEIMPE